MTLANGRILSQNITNGNVQNIVTATPNTLGGFIYTRSEYNPKGQLTKLYQDTGWNTAKIAATLCVYIALTIGKKVLTNRMLKIKELVSLLPVIFANNCQIL